MTFGLKRSSPIAAILVAIFVLKANFHTSQPGSILFVITPAVTISIRAVNLGPHSHITVVSVHITSHLPHTIVAVAVTRTGSRIAANATIFLSRLV